MPRKSGTITVCVPASSAAAGAHMSPVSANPCSITMAGPWPPIRTCNVVPFVDGSVVNVGLPAIGRSLHAEAAALQWIVNAYLLPLSALLLLGGALGDRLGRRRILIFGVLLFAIGSVFCAAAVNLQWLLA